jgi:hypothetical protein
MGKLHNTELMSPLSLTSASRACWLAIFAVSGRTPSGPFAPFALFPWFRRLSE